MDKLITRKEAASILGISVKTLDAARTDGLISYVQYVENGCVYFTEVGIQEYIAKCTHRAKPMERAVTYATPSVTPGRRFPRRPFSFSPASADPVRCAAECAPNRRGLPLPYPAAWHLRSRPVIFQSSGQRILDRSNRFPTFHAHPGTLPKSGTGNHSSRRSGHFL